MTRHTARRDCESGDSGIGEFSMRQPGSLVLAWSLSVGFGIPQSPSPSISGEWGG